MKVAIYPGSFDPITMGHLDIIKRASVLFDKIVVVVMINSAKHSTFTVAERMDFLKRVTDGIDNIEIDTYTGLLADYAEIKNATAVVKGLRVLSDFEYEFQMALTNVSLNPKLETVFLPSNKEYMFLSSSIVREVASHGRDISALVPPQILEDIVSRLYKRN